MIEKNELLWKVKGATLSDKSACKEYKISREEIIQGINEGKLQYRVNYVYGNPWFRLLRQELEKFIAEIVIKIRIFSINGNIFQILYFYLIF